KPDGTRDWEAIFEDPQRGLVTLANKAETPAQLNETMITMVKMLFGRRGDAANIEKFTALVTEMAPADGEAKQLDKMKSHISRLMREIKDERERKVAEYLSANKAKKGGDRRAPPTRRRPPAAKKAPPPPKSTWRTVFAVWAILASLGAGGLGYLHL
ncbi:MAG: hypothetical protein QGF09_13695, partial [Rhodospirillales bacterium]|nr:hypothetical protein [Rhodospirillales bacterium]